MSRTSAHAGWSDDVPGEGVVPSVNCRPVEVDFGGGFSLRPASAAGLLLQAPVVEVVPACVVGADGLASSSQIPYLALIQEALMSNAVTRLFETQPTPEQADGLFVFLSAVAATVCAHATLRPA